MKVVEKALDGLMLLECMLFADERGSFMETWSAPKYTQAGLPDHFPQDNLSLSRRGVLRGLHFQNPNAQGKLVSCLKGRVFDVAVDLRTGSPTFKRWYGAELSAENRRQLWVPPGFAHGFLTLEDDTLFLYKCTETYAPNSEGSLLWNDESIGIQWPLAPGEVPSLSPKDAAAPRFAEIPPDKLFR